jgi:hypothetical protein
MKFASAAGARSWCKASASPRAIAIAPRAKVIQTTAFRPVLCRDRLLGVIRNG